MQYKTVKYKELVLDLVKTYIQTKKLDHKALDGEDRLEVIQDIILKIKRDIMK